MGQERDSGFFCVYKEVVRKKNRPPETLLLCHLQNAASHGNSTFDEDLQAPLEEKRCEVTMRGGCGILHDEGHKTRNLETVGEATFVDDRTAALSNEIDGLSNCPVSCLDHDLTLAVSAFLDALPYHRQLSMDHSTSDSYGIQP